MSNLVDNIIYKKLKKIDSKFIPKIDTLYEHVYSVLPKMNNIFDNYTEHGIDHSLRVLNYMSQLIYDVEKLSELELTMIIYVALLHDIGMVVGESEKNSLTDNSINEFGMKYSVIKEEYNNEKYRVGYDIYSWRYNKSDKIQKIYNKNVYLSKMSVVIPYISNMINLGNITINLCHREVIPNLARDNVDENYLLESIGFAIGKGIHLYLLENEMLAEEQKELLRIFIDKYYGSENIFLSR